MWNDGAPVRGRIRGTQDSQLRAPLRLRRGAEAVDAYTGGGSGVSVGASLSSSSSSE